MKGTIARSDFRFIVDIVPQAARVLDLGCGNGELLALLSEHRGVKGRGIELTESGVRECVARGLSVRQGDIDEGLGDYPSGSFDYVILSQTLPYVDDPARLLREMLRVGRQAVISFPNLGHWRPRICLLTQGKLGSDVVESAGWFDPPRARPISIADFKSLCTEASIEIADEFLLGNPGRLKGWMAQSVFARVGLYVLKEKTRSTPH